MKKRTTWRQPCRAMRCRRPRYTFHLRMLITEVAAKVVSRTRSIIIIMTDMVPATPSTWFSSRPPTCSSFACDQTHTSQSQQATSVYNSEELVNLWPILSFSRVPPSPPLSISSYRIAIRMCRSFVQPTMNGVFEEFRAVSFSTWFSWLQNSYHFK